MLKDKSKRWVVVNISQDLWKKIKDETLQGIITLLESAEKLLNAGGDVRISAGLYTYAVEEYGKLLLLKNCKPSSGIVEIRFRDWFGNHQAKFDIATKYLPKECIRLYEAGFADEFENGFEKVRVVADFEARLAIFYTDLTDSGSDIKPVPPVDKELLKKAIDKLGMISVSYET